MNQTTLVGVLPRNPHMISPTGNQDFPIALFSVKTYDPAQGINFPSVKAFDELAILANDLLQEGTNVRIEGYIRSESWMPKGKNAKKVYKDILVATSIVALSDARPVEADPHAEALAELDAQPA